MTVAPSGDGHWTGKTYDLQRRLRYRLTIRVAGDAMTTNGCVSGGLICKSMAWTRIKD